MKAVITTLSTFFIVLHAQPCKMHLQSVENNTTQFTLTLSHEANCEILMDESQSKIVLISKKQESNVTLRPTKQVFSTNMTDKLIALAKSKLGDS